VEWLHRKNVHGTAGMLRDAIAGDEAAGMDPEILWQLAEENTCDVEISCASSANGCFDVVFSRRTDAGGSGFVRFNDSIDEDVPWHSYANNPLQEKFSRVIVPQLRKHLKERLPAHMVPSDFVVLRKMPLGPSGKIDRSALPPPAPRKGAADTYVAPRTQAEEKMAGLWAEVLGVEHVGINDNFFELGGHSIKATQVISRINREFSLELAVRDVFEKPTVEELTAFMESKEQSAYAAIRRVPDAAYYPVSHAQRRLWVIAQMEGGSRAYNMPGSLLLEGEIDVSILQSALDQLVRRHESLRTVFAVIQGEPHQKVHDNFNVRCEVVDLSAAGKPDDEARQLAMQDAARAFDLEKGPLLRVTLARMAHLRHVLLFNMHHIISDDWSMDVLVREFMRIYEAARKGTSADLPELRIQYRDYACWQNEMIHSEKFAGHRGYWHDKLKGEIPVLDLPIDSQRPRLKTYNGNEELFRLDSTLLRDLLNICQQRNISIFMFLVSAVKVLLHRYTGQEDIIVGCPVAGRNHADIESQIGFYINTLALRDTVSAAMTFESLLAEVSQTAISAFEHQEYPFDMLVDELKVARDTSRHPLFDVMVVLQNVGATALSLENVRITPFVNEYAISKFDLSFTFEEKPDGLMLAIVYNTDLFSAGRIRRMGAQFEELVRNVVKEPGVKVGEVNILPEEERRLVGLEWNRTGSEYPEGSTIIDLFRESARKEPGAVAVVFEGREVTYRELDEVSDRVAGVLRRRYGVKRGDLVGVLMDKSGHVIEVFLGILKAGAGYVPMDPEYPEERIRYIVKDSGIRVVVTEERWKGLVEGVAAVVTGEERGEDAGGVEADPVEAGMGLNDPDSVAYVIYTSGSTGKPKGCMVTHRNVVRLMKNRRFCFEFSEKDVWVVAHSFCFDFSVWEMYGALLYGGRVVVVSREDARNSEAFREILRKHRVSVLNQTPAAFYNLMEVERVAGVHDLGEHLRYVIYGGDRLEPTHLQDWVKMYPLSKVKLVNMYGITETTVHVTYGPLTESDIFEGYGRSPVGVPLPETTVYVCDERMNLQPIGVAGEIYVGGTGVSRGYLNRPELTKERFVASPFKDGERLYRSGDVGRWLEDGRLEHLGRNDSQVQIRGFRVELGEVESVLAGHPKVREAVVLMREDMPGDQRLAGYVVWKDGGVTVDELKAHAKSRLPEYMVPASLTVLERVPLTSNGKVDRKALPKPEHGAGTGREHVMPRNELESRIAGVWQEVLGLATISVHDNFFEIGGHSLGIIKVANRLKTILGRDIPVVMLFQYPTVESLASFIGGDQKEDRTAYEEIGRRVRMQREARQRRQRGNGNE
jgi:amino acid adenylation domain-containing protein